jgi:hypothetical protein
MREALAVTPRAHGFFPERLRVTTRRDGVSSLSRGASTPRGLPGPAPTDGGMFMPKRALLILSCRKGVIR